jgi:hypothetical protein
MQALSWPPLRRIIEFGTRFHMAKLNRLMKGQDLAFDTHQAGDRQSVNWLALHMEK